MKRRIVVNIIFALLFVVTPQKAFCDYVLGCLVGKYLKVYNMSEQGDISFDYEVYVAGNPDTLEFAPDGHWGLIGSHTTSYIHTQRTIVLEVEKNRTIRYAGYVHNELGKLISITPDSRYGVYGGLLKTIRYLGNGNFNNIAPPASEELYVAMYDSDFSSYNHNLIAMKSLKTVAEYTLLEDGRTTSTGVVMDISPAQGNHDLEITPDGRTCIIVDPTDYSITVLRIYKGGGISISQQFNSILFNPRQVDFTPDSKYAIITSLHSRDPNILSYRISWDSKLTEAGREHLPGFPGERMAVTPDGKFAVTREVISGVSYFYVVRINEDGTLEYLPQKDFEEVGHVAGMDFLPPYKTSADEVWTEYK